MTNALHPAPTKTADEQAREFMARARNVLSALQREDRNRKTMTGPAVSLSRH